MIAPPEVFKCLADETRVRATLLIAEQGELCVCELMCALGDSQPKVSRHLAQLRAAGLLLDRRQGQWVYYRLNPALPAWVHEVLRVTLQANADGYDQPILLNREGHVAEGTGATFFMVRKGRLVTPPITADILESITRTTLMDSICPELLGMGVVEREIDRTELYVADEAFFCGSGYEITPILSIDKFPVGDGKELTVWGDVQDPARAQAADLPEVRHRPQ